MDFDQGIYKIKCVKPGGYTLDGYGGYSFDEGEELDLLDNAVSSYLRCADYQIAHNVCTDPNLEIAQLIASGDFQIVETRRPQILKPGGPLIGV